MLGDAIEIFIEGMPVSLAKVRAWEHKDALKACRTLGIKPAGQTLSELNVSLKRRKDELGHDGIRALLARQTAMSDRFSRFLAWASRGKRRTSVIEIVCDRGSAEGFTRWYHELVEQDREDQMLAAEPQHYIIATDSMGRQEVIETTGGAPLAARIFIDYEDLSSLTTPPDPAFPYEMAGVARSLDGTAIGGVRHMVRDEGTGFRARFIVEFPALIMPNIVPQHRWHLACEWSNWIAMWLDEIDPPSR